MATSPTTQSALQSGAAKDDVVGLNSYTFTINDLLANDPGGAAKVDTDTQFFFGDTAADRANQAQYLIDHGITDNLDGTYTITPNGTDFSYFVQIGNKGTWSQGDVDVNAPANIFVENFDNYGADTQQTYYDGGEAVFAAVDLNAANDWTGAQNSELGANGYGDIETTSGEGETAFWLDSQNSPGGINISHAFTDANGGQAHLSFDIAVQDLVYLGKDYETNPDASIEFRIDNVVVASLTYQQVLDGAGAANEMFHVDAYFNTTGAQQTLTIEDTSDVAGFTGFAIDSIRIDDWFA